MSQLLVNYFLPTRCYSPCRSLSVSILVVVLLCYFCISLCYADRMMAPEEAAESQGPLPSEHPDIRCDGTKEYEIRMEYSWKPSIPADPDKNNPGFSPMICAAHRPEYSLWKQGVLASPAIKSLFATRKLDALIAELKSNMNTNPKRVFSFSNSSEAHISSPGTDRVVLEVSGDRPNATLISCIAVLVPSPDWFVGLSAEETCTKANQTNPSTNTTVSGFSFIEQKVVPLAAWDAGLDDLDQFVGEPKPVVPPGKDINIRLGHGESFGRAVVQAPSAALKSPEPPAQNITNSTTPTCFPADATVELASGLRVSMEELQTSQRILSSTVGRYSDVFMFSHSDAAVWSKFVQFSFFDPSTNQSSKLSVSHGHYIYLLRGSDLGSYSPSKAPLVAANQARVGDYLITRNGKPARIVRVAERVARGLYNPHTLDGTLFVDGVLVSSYTRAVEPRIAEGLLHPIRILHRWGLSRWVDAFTRFTLAGGCNLFLAQFLPSVI